MLAVEIAKENLAIAIKTPTSIFTTTEMKDTIAVLCSTSNCRPIQFAKTTVYSFPSIHSLHNILSYATIKKSVKIA